MLVTERIKCGSLCKASFQIALAISFPISMSLLASCTPTGSSVGQPDSSKSLIEQRDLANAAAGEAQPEQSTEMGSAEVAQVDAPQQTAQVLVPEGNGSPGVELIGQGSSETLLIKGDIKEGDYKVSRYNSPDRIVVDLLKSPGKISRVFATENSSVIEKVRVGAHPDSTRIVLDLAKGAEVNHQVELTNQGLSVAVFSPTGVSPTMPMAAPRPELFNQASNQDQSINSEKIAESSVIQEDSELIANSQSGQSAAPELSETQATGQLAKTGAPVSVEEQMNLTPHVNSVKLEPLGAGENSVIAEVSSAGFFTLKQSAQSEYVLSVEGATIEETAKIALVAPADSGAIRSVRTVQKDGDVQLRIFTSPGTSLEARPMPASDGSGMTKIVVARTTVANKMDDSTARAQAAEPQAEPESEPAVLHDVGANPDTPTDAPVVESDIAALLQESPQFTGRLISLDLQDTDIDNALRIIAEVSNLNIIASEDVTGKVTLRLIDVPWDQALDVILKTNGLDKVQEGNVIRIAPVEKLRQEREALKQAREAEDSLEPLRVKYARISYSRAAEMKPLVETVLSERGTVAYDDRTNQLIVKDIQRGLKNVAELIAKIDLRTPQVLLETQIVEAKRNLLRDLGAQLGFSYVRSPATGNATGSNFPNSIDIGGGLPGNVASSFPAAVSLNAGSAISMLFGSADGSKSLDLRLSALEQDGRIRVVSRPAVATINNRPAVIKSVEKIRVKLPSGGTSVATGQGATASGGASAATETIEIGIELFVTPQASPDYYVLLDLKAKSSTFGARQVEGIPSEIERSANSTVLVSSGQTFAMGGIYKTEDNESVTGVPFLKDIPVLGTFFRQTKIDNSDEELLFFVTPRIIEGSFDDAAMRAAS